MEDNSIRSVLLLIAGLLESGGESSAATRARNALSSGGKKLDQFLTSNDLWGGSGSVADKAMINNHDKRVALETLMCKLGKMQIAEGNVNARTRMWTDVFEGRQLTPSK